MKKIVVVGVLCALGAWSPGLKAATVDCATVSTFQDLLDLGQEGCFSQDKIWSNFQNGASNPVPGGTSVEINFVEVVPGVFDFHNLVLENLGPGTYQFGYTIEVDPNNPAATAFFITGSTTGVDIGFDPVTVDKTLTDPATGNTYALHSTGPNDQVSFSPTTKLITADVTVVVGSGGFANSVSDQYVESAVPEPAAYSLLGLGLLGLGLFRRRIKG